jgi:type IV pilus assembly protein PilV
MKRVKPQLSAESGFTLIEVLIGVSIFAIGLLGVAALQMHAVRNTSIGNVTSQATMLANQKMEQVKATAFDDLVVNEVENNIDPDGNAGGIYNRTTTITTPAAPLDAYMRQVQVQVQWDAAHGGNRTVTVNSLTYNRW